MESKQITRHQVDVWITVRNSGPHGLSSNEIAARTELPGRTVRSHALRLMQLGIFEEVKTYPLRYRMASGPSQRARLYLARLEEAAEVYETTSGPRAGARCRTEAMASTHGCSP